MQKLISKLREFKLAGMANSIESRLAYANEKSVSYAEFMELLCEDESCNRRDNSYNKRIIKAKLPVLKKIEDFDFTFQPSIDRKHISDLVTCQYIEQKHNVIFIGNPGTGKTHLSIALAVKALQKDYKVLFTSIGDMLYKLHISKADNSYYKKLEEYLNPDLLVMDELGFKKVEGYSGADFFDVISRRYENGSSIITTNKNFDQWNEVFADNVLSSAILDRVVHHARIFKINGASYRTKNIKNDGGSDEKKFLN